MVDLFGNMAQVATHPSTNVVEQVFANGWLVDDNFQIID